MRIRFDGKTVVVSGAGHGFGRCITETFAQLGARVFGCDLSAAELAETAKAGVQTEMLDLTDRAAAAAWIVRIEQTTGGAVDVLQPDAALVGGITGLKRIAILAQEHHLVFTPHTWTNGMGVTANAHLVAGLCDAPYFEYPFDPPEWTLQRRDFMLTEPLRVDGEGWINLGDAPGMGYTLDEERLRATRIS